MLKFLFDAKAVTHRTLSPFDSSDGRVDRASTSDAINSGLIPSQVFTVSVQPMTLILVFTASLLCHSPLKGQREEQAGKFICGVA